MIKKVRDLVRDLSDRDESFDCLFFFLMWSAPWVLILGGAVVFFTERTQ